MISTKITDEKEAIKESVAIQVFIEQMDNFLRNKDSNYCFSDDGDFTLKLSPANVLSYSRDFVKKAGQKILLLTATAPDTQYLSSLFSDGKSTTNHISSIFPVKNHNVVYFPCGSLVKMDLKENIHTIIDNLKTILKIHKNEKGIIHTRTKFITQAIADNIQDKRLLFYKTSITKAEIIKKHKETDSPTVLVGPGLVEGLDLPGQEATFQVLIKVPFLNHRDDLNKRKGRDWMTAQTITDIEQSLGRAIRTPTDKVTTYFLDPLFKIFFIQNAHKFQPHVIEAIKNGVTHEHRPTDNLDEYFF